MKNNIIYYLIVLVIFCVLTPVSSIFGAGATAMDFLNIGVGARPVAMGEAFVALADDANAVFWNPAGLGQLKRYEVTFMHNVWFQEISYNYFAYVHPLKIGALGVSVYHVQYGKIQGYDAGGAMTEELCPYDLAGVLSFGTTLLDEKDRVLLSGANFKFIHENLDVKEATAIAIDAGFIYQTVFLVPLNLGFVVQNLGPNVRFFEEKESLPLNYKFGTVIKLIGGNLNLALDLTISSDDEIFINTGGEYRLLNFIFMRVGYRAKQALDTGLRCGLGITGKNVFLDYSYVPYEELGETHRFSLSMRFGKKYGYSHIENEVENQFEQAKQHFYHGQLLTAHRELKEILALVPGHEGAQEYFARIQVKVEKGIISQEIDRHVEAGEKYFKSGEIVKAQAEFELVLSFDTENKIAKNYLVKISKRFKEVIDSMLTRGKTYYEKGDYELARKEMEKILSFDPEHSDGKKYIVLIKEKQKEIEKIKMAQKAGVHYRKGELLYKNKKLNSALKQFKQAYKLDPEHKDISTWINKLESEINRAEKEKKMKIAVEYYKQGVDFYKSNKLKLAIEKLENTLKYDSKHKEAKEYLRKAKDRLKTLNKEKAEEYNRKGLIEYTKGNIKKAIEFWEKALGYDPDNEEVRTNLERARKEFKE